jgi:hypothetical protein
LSPIGCVLLLQTIVDYHDHLKAVRKRDRAKAKSLSPTKKDGDKSTVCKKDDKTDSAEHSAKPPEPIAPPHSGGGGGYAPSFSCSAFALV